MSPFTDTNGTIPSLLAGGTAGVLSWVFTMPIDTIKSKVQAQAMGKENIGMWQCTKDTYKTSGVRGLYRGLVIASVRAFPVNAVTFVVYTKTLNALNEHPAHFASLEENIA